MPTDKLIVQPMKMNAIKIFYNIKAFAVTIVPIIRFSLLIEETFSNEQYTSISFFETLKVPVRK